MTRPLSTSPVHKRRQNTPFRTVVHAHNAKNTPFAFRQAAEQQDHSRMGRIVLHPIGRRSDTLNPFPAQPPLLHGGEGVPREGDARNHHSSMLSGSSTSFLKAARNSAPTAPSTTR